MTNSTVHAHGVSGLQIPPSLNRLDDVGYPPFISPCAPEEAHDPVASFIALLPWSQWSREWHPDSDSICPYIFAIVDQSMDLSLDFFCSLELSGHVKPH